VLCSSSCSRLRFRCSTVRENFASKLLSMFWSIWSVIIVFGEKMCRQRLLSIDFDSGFPCDFSPLCSFFLHARPSAVKTICVLMRDQSLSRRMFLDVTPVACLFASPGQEHPRSWGSGDMRCSGHIFFVFVSPTAASLACPLLQISVES